MALKGVEPLPLVYQTSTLPLSYRVHLDVHSLPVGALTLKPSAYTYRPWEVHPVRVVDRFDYTPTGVVLQVRGSQVVRTTAPGWLADRTRFAYDGFRRQRLVRPYRWATPVGWAAGVYHWWARVATGWATLQAGPADRVGHLARLVRWMGRPGGGRYTYVYDLRCGGSLFHGPFGVGGYPLALPALLDYEADGAVPPPVALTGWAALAVQAARPAPPGWTPPGGSTLWTPPGGGHRTARTVLQVSPLVRSLYRCC